MYNMKWGFYLCTMADNQILCHPTLMYNMKWGFYLCTMADNQILCHPTLMYNMKWGFYLCTMADNQILCHIKKNDVRDLKKKKNGGGVELQNVIETLTCPKPLQLVLGLCVVGSPHISSKQTPNRSNWYWDYVWLAPLTSRPNKPQTPQPFPFTVLARAI